MLLGIVIDFSEEHPEKTSLLMEFMLFGIVIDVRDVQFLNAPFPIEVMLLGLVIDFSEEHPEKASS